MIHPSYVDLMKVVNKGVEEGETPVINSRYSIVMATAKRARQIVDGDEPMINAADGTKPLSIAVEELRREKIRILAEDEPDEEFGEEFIEEDELLEAEAAPAYEIAEIEDDEESGEEVIIYEEVEEDNSDSEYDEA